MPVSQSNFHLLEKRALTDLPDSQSLSDGRDHQHGIADRRQRDKADTVSKAFTHLHRCLQAKMSLANTAWA